MKVALVCIFLVFSFCGSAQNWETYVLNTPKNGNIESIVVKDYSVSDSFGHFVNRYEGKTFTSFNNQKKQTQYIDYDKKGREINKLVFAYNVGEHNNEISHYYLGSLHDKVILAYNNNKLSKRVEYNNDGSISSSILYNYVGDTITNDISEHSGFKYTAYYIYDSSKNLIESYNGDYYQRKIYSIDSLGRISTIEAFGDAQQHKSYFTYDSAGNVISCNTYKVYSEGAYGKYEEVKDDEVSEYRIASYSVDIQYDNNKNPIKKTLYANVMGETQPIKIFLYNIKYR